MSVEAVSVGRQSVTVTFEQSIIGGDVKMSVRAEGLTTPMDGAIICNKGVEFFIGQIMQAVQPQPVLTGN